MLKHCATYHQVINDIRDSTLSAGRAPESVRLLAVSKRQSPLAIRSLASCGQRAFGENYLQEAETKIAALRDLDLEWHFIGPLQSNKTAGVAELFDWVHTVERSKIAQRLNDQRPSELPPLNICVQVNVSGEMSKSGVSPDSLSELLEYLPSLPNLRFRGLMALPRPVDDFNQQRAMFKHLREIYLQAVGTQTDTLSIGTSSDYRAAIFEGATIVRIGTALFGARDQAGN